MLLSRNIKTIINLLHVIKAPYNRIIIMLQNGNLLKYFHLTLSLITKNTFFFKIFIAFLYQVCYYIFVNKLFCAK